ncbi:MAG: hypothetical protein HYV08_09435 [Deltaproteobacteria bacterium]|nr:hypothetical protein [Deltaproteobacteria bacterium]
MAQEKALTNGAAAAAALASGIGSLALGLFTTLAQAIVPVKDALNLYNPVGPLSGKTTAAVAVWVVSWAILHGLWKDRQVEFGRVFLATLILIALGLLGTFPPFFEAFGG